jgi:hypothetical protein
MPILLRPKKHIRLGKHYRELSIHTERTINVIPWQ